jgi:hypothetical protein
MLRLLACLLTVLFLTGCGDNSSTLLSSFTRSTFPATKYFTGALLPLAQSIEDDDLPALEQGLTHAPGNTCQNAEQQGMTLLLYAMMNRRKAAMQVLLKHHTNPNQNTHVGENKLQVQPVGIAAASEDAEILKILLDHGGSPNSRYNDEPAVFAAIKGNHFDHMRLLLDRGADINAPNGYGETLMMALANGNQFEQIAYLIRRGADVHKPDSHGATLAFSVQDAYVSSTLPEYQQQQLVKKLLTEQGIHFPVPHPGIAFQAKVRQENRQRRQWEATTVGAQWLARIKAAEALSTTAAANEAMQLRQQAEPVFQAWRKTQPDWFTTTNGGSFPLYNSPRDRDLVPEPTDSVQQEAN